MAILRSMWIWTATSILVLLWIPLMFIVSRIDRDPKRLKTARWFRRLGPLVARVNPSWRLSFAGFANIQTDRTYVIVSNHQSLADIPLISHLQHDTKWLAKAELFRVPVFGWMMKASGDVPVDRGDRRKAAQALLRCAAYLRQGCSVVFFPEGTRSRDGSVLPFNDGPFQLAIREKMAVLPLVVEGTGTALPRNSWLFGPRQDITLRVLDPVAPDGWEDSGAFRDNVRQRIIDELDRLRGCKLTAG